MYIFIISLTLIVVYYYTHERIDINLADEGFLWNGTLRTSSGLIPTYDFKSYDPGRFYWTTFCSKLFGKGLLGLRKSVALFQFFGLWAGLDIVNRIIDNKIYLLGTGVLFLWWMMPRHKRFEHVMSLLNIWFGVLLFEHANNINMFLICGIFVGFSVFMGRNHGLYSLSSFTIFFIIINFDIGLYLFVKTGLYFCCGVMIGYLPMLFMWALIPGFYKKYKSDKVINILQGNVIKFMKIPFPWPWEIKIGKDSLNSFIADLLRGLLFIIMPILYSGAIVYIGFLGNVNDVTLKILLVSSIVGMFYLHHGYNRTDLPHLCQITQPLIVVILSIVCLQNNELSKYVILIIFTLISFILVVPLNPVVKKWRFPSSYISFDLNGDTLQIDKTIAMGLDKIKSFVKENIKTHESILIVPISPMLYPILQVKTPVFSDFLLFPEKPEKQHLMISDLEKNKVNWLFINNQKINNNEGLRFKNTHKIVWEYILNNFNIYDNTNNYLSHKIYVRKNRL